MKHKSNAALPAYPNAGFDPAIDLRVCCLTKRELFAAMAMQGYCAVYEGWNEPADEIARCSVAMADALLAQLSKES